MAKSRENKSELLRKYTDLIKNTSGYILVDTSGLDTATITKLKIKLKESGSEYVVVKNSVFKIALQETDQPIKTQEFDGPTAVISYSQDPTSPAKLIKDLQKETEKFGAKLGTLNGDYLPAERIMELADIPSREELLAKLLGSLNAPISGFAKMLSGNLKDFTVIIRKLSEKSE